MAKKYAEHRGVDITKVTGTGPNGRIRADDILNAEKNPPTAVSGEKQGASSSKKPGQSSVTIGEGTFKDEQLSTMRKVIGQRLTESKQNLPHYYVTMDIKMDKLLKYFVCNLIASEKL